MFSFYYRPLILLISLLVAMPAMASPLASWNDGASKRAIITFVHSVTDKTGRFYLPPAQRIAVFDNDGTLWSEQPMYFQLAFALDRVKALAPQHPEWKTQQPFKAVLDGDMKSLLAGEEKVILKLVMATHAGNTTGEFARQVKHWIARARHPKTARRYTRMVFQPMLELLDYLRANHFKTYIVSGGGIEFIRPWSEQVYGVPPEQVIGSSIRTRFEMRDGKPVLVRLPKIDFINDKAGKPVAINRFIGRRPVFAFGNSDGDLQMLQWTMADKGKHFAGLIHHTDAKREYAYDRKSSIGHLDKALDIARQQGWTVVDMQRDWKRIYP